MTTIKLRRGTAAEWTSSNPVLNDGEVGFEHDTNKHKIGDGVTAWSALKYFINEDAINTAFVPRWKPNTAYLSGAAVLSPNGDVVTAKVNFTSGSSYSATNWNSSTLYSAPADHIDVLPASLAIIGGTPAMAYVSGLGAGMMFDGTADETTFVGVPVPSDWTSVNLELFWTIASTGTVRWKTYVSSFAVGSLWPTGSSLISDVAVTNASKQIRSAFNSAVTVIPGSMVTVRIDRLASSSVDTIVADACLQLIRLTKAA